MLRISERRPCCPVICTRLSAVSGAGPALVADNSRSFAQVDELVGGNLLVLFVQPIGPVDVEIYRIESTQAKMQAGIAARVKAGLAKHGLGLCLTPRATTRAPIALRFDLTPSSLTLIQFCFCFMSFRNSDGDSFRLTIRMSMSPSLSKSPNAQPRLQCASVTPGPASCPILRTCDCRDFDTLLAAICSGIAAI
jgi:hypothetical protein